VNKINKIENLTCHCKEVQIELKLNNGLEEIVRCNCSLCKKRGSIMAKIKLKNLKIIKGSDKLKLYKFGKNKAEHFFCSICGIYTHHKSYIKIPFNGMDKQQFNYYFEPRMQEYRGICSMDDIAGNWIVKFSGTQYEDINFEILNQVSSWDDRLMKPVC